MLDTVNQISEKVTSLWKSFMPIRAWKRPLLAMMILVCLEAAGDRDASNDDQSIDIASDGTI